MNDNERSNRGSQNRRSFEGEQIQKHDHFVPTIPQPALDDIAVKATVSLLNDFAKRFLKNEDFRTSLHHICFSLLNLTGLENQNANSEIIANLEEVVEVVERAAEDSTSAKELKGASLKLSVITGLNSNDLRMGSH